MHRSLQTLTPGLHEIGDSHAEPPSQRMSHVEAEHSMPPWHTLALRPCTMQFDPAHLILPWQLDGAVQSIAHVVPVMQSTPPRQETEPLHPTWQAIPSGHLTSGVHE